MVYHSLAFRATFDILNIFIDGRPLISGSYHIYELRLRCEHEESNAEHSICTSGEDGERRLLTIHLDLHLSTLRASDPVFLCLLDRVAPLYSVESVEQTLAVSADAEAPLAHLLLLYRESATHADTIHHLVVGKHSTETSTPVYHCLAHESDAIVHESVALLLLVHSVPFLSRERELIGASGRDALRAVLFEVSHEVSDRLSLLKLGVEIRSEHLLESPLSPFIVAWSAGAHLTVPVEREANLVQLLAIAVDILESGLLRMLSGLYSILLSRQSVSVITHRIQHVEALQALVSGIYITGDIAEWVAHMESRT